MVALLLLACSSTPAVVDTGLQPSVCPSGSLEPGVVEVLATGFDVDGTVGTEGLVFSPDGRLFVGGSGIGGGGYVAEIFLDGTWTRLVDVPQSIGLAWHDERVLVATGDVGTGEGGLVSVDPDTLEVEEVATGIPDANFPAPTPWGTILVSVPSGETVWEVADGGVSVWAEGVPSPNGIAITPDGSRVYVANTYVTPSTVASIPVTDGVAGPVGTLATLPDGSTQDGVALDAEGNLYVVNNLPGTLARITPSGDWDIVAEGIDFGASIAFGTGDWDPCSVYATSLFGPDVFRVGVGARGL